MKIRPLKYPDQDKDVARWREDVRRELNEKIDSGTIADATGAGDVVAQLNALLATLRTAGILTS